MVVFKDGPADDDYEDMVEEASQFGKTFLFIQYIVTHTYIS
jgi:hypothetical protein